MASSRRIASTVLAAALFALSVGVSGAIPATSGQVTISMLAYSNQQPALNVLIPNFERVYPDIKINVTYAPTVPILQQLETTELSAGSAADLLAVAPDCGTIISVCVLAKDGYLAPMVGKPWAKRSVPLITSADKYGGGLFAFSAEISPFGIFTNDDLFGKLGLQVPQTFAQLLTLCQKAKADGTAAIVESGDAASLTRLVQVLATPLVYGTDPKWTSQLRAAQTTFDGTHGWHTALQELADMNSAGCFEPGFLGTTPGAAPVEFAQGQGLIYANTSSQKGGIDAAGPQFAYSFHAFPGSTVAGETTVPLNLNLAPAVNAHSSAANQAAAQTFVDFLGRPAQTKLYAQIEGGVSQFEFAKGDLPSFMSSLAPLFKAKDYIVLPEQTWWNAGVSMALQQALGLITGQTTIDGVLNAMDAAWKQGPS